MFQQGKREIIAPILFTVFGSLSALAEVDPKIHKLCIDAKDYPGCMRSMMGAESCVYDIPDSNHGVFNKGVLAAVCIHYERGRLEKDIASRTFTSVNANHLIPEKDKQLIWAEFERSNLSKCKKIMKELGLKFFVPKFEGKSSTTN